MMEIELFDQGGVIFGALQDKKLVLKRDPGKCLDQLQGVLTYPGPAIVDYSRVNADAHG
jgi:hypothetical protein